MLDLNHRRTLRAAVEAIEPRTLLSTSFASLNSTGTLSVVGTSGADTIDVGIITGQGMVARRNGAFLSFDESKVKRIWIDGLAGNDSVTNRSELPSTMVGSSGNDTFMGDVGIDTITYADRGVPFEFAGRGRANGDVVWDARSGAEHDVIEAYTVGSSIENIVGTPQADVFNEPSLFGISLYGGAGNDRFFEIDSVGENGSFPLLDAGPGNDELHLHEAAAFDDVRGGSGNDRITLDDGGFAIDTLTIGSLDGGTGDDTLSLATSVAPTVDLSRVSRVQRVTGIGTKASQTIVGGPSADRFEVSPTSIHAVTLLGHGGNDTLIGGRGNDSLNGGSGDDVLIGNAGNDTLWGSDGNDSLTGGGGRDLLLGRAGNDTIFARDSRTDTLDGGSGTDRAQRDKTSTITDQVTSIESFIA